MLKKSKIQHFGFALAISGLLLSGAPAQSLTCADLFTSSSVAPIRADRHSLFSSRIAAIQKEVRELNHHSEIVIRDLEQRRGHQWPELDPNVMVALAIAVTTQAPETKEALLQAMSESPQLGYLTRKDAEPVARLLVHQSTATDLFPARMFLYRILHDRGLLRFPAVTRALEQIYQNQMARFHLLAEISQLEPAAKYASDIATLREFEAARQRIPADLQNDARLEDSTLDQVLKFAKQGRAESETAFRSFMESDPFFKDFSDFSKHSVIFQLDHEVPKDKARMILLRRKSFSNPALEMLIYRYDALVKAEMALRSKPQ